MYCGKCGSQIKDGAAFCPVCGKSFQNAPVRPEANRQKQPKKPDSQPRKTKGRQGPGVLGWVAVVLVVATLAGLVGLAAVGRSNRLSSPQSGEAGVTLPGGAEVYTAEAWENEAPDLRLYLSERIFLIGQEEELTITVKCSEAVTEDVTVTDESGNEIAVLTNDGSGELKTTLNYGRAEESVGYMIAKSGEFTSQPEDFSVQPEVTEEMVDTLLGVCGDIQDFLGQKNFDDPYGEDAFGQMRTFLKDHADVMDVEEYSGILFYRTKDGLQGSYGMGNTTDGFAGSAQYSGPIEEFYYQLDGNDTSNDILYSFSVPTNSECLILTPDEDDSNKTMKNHSEMVEKAMKGVFQPVTYLKNKAAQDCLVTGDFTDCGILFLNAHGNYIQRKPPKKDEDRVAGITYDNSDMMYLNIGQVGSNNETVKQYLSQMNHGYQLLFSQLGGEDKSQKLNASSHATLDTTENQITVRLTSRYFDMVLAGKTFDNTVVYLFVCFAFRDEQLLKTLFDHGASMVIGCRNEFNQSYSKLIIGELTRELIKPNQNGLYATYSECLAVGASSQLIDNTMYGGFEPPYSKEELDATLNYFKSLSEKELKPLFPKDASKRKTITTDKIGENGKPIKKLDVSKYGKNVRNYNEDIFQNYANLMYFYRQSEWTDALVEYKPASPSQEHRVLHGNGSLSGQVRTIDGTPLAGAEVTAYQWMNHKFIQNNFSPVTDEDGMYIFPDLPYGVYVLEAWYDGRTAITSIELNQLENEADDIFLDTLGNIILTSEIICEDTDYRGDTASEKICFLPQVLEAPTPEIQHAIDEIADNMLEAYNEKNQWNHDGLEVTPLSYYCNRNILSISTHAWDMQFIDENNYTNEEFLFLNANIDTGENVSFPAILSSREGHPVVKGAWQQLVDEHAKMDDWWASENGGTAVTDAMAGRLGGWAFTPHGLSLELYEEYAIRGGRYHTVVPYEKLRGEILDKYIFTPKVSTAMSGSVVPISPQQAEADSKNWTVWGTPTNLALKVYGIASNLQVHACVNTYAGIRSKGVVFYARYLNDAITWLPDWQEEIYKVTWESGGQDFAIIIENGEVTSYQRLNATGLCYPVPSEAYFNTPTPLPDDSGLEIYQGINVNVSTDTPVYAIADGTATFYQDYAIIDGVDTLTGYGNYVEFTSNDRTITAKYCHLGRFENVDQVIPSSATQMREGTDGKKKLTTRNVRAGDILGYIGSTGNSGGTLLHFELWKNDKRIDPVDVFPNLRMEHKPVMYEP